MSAHAGSVRRLLSAGTTAGGLLGVVSFFLPWVMVSCDGALLGSVSPYERMTGVALESAEGAPVRVSGFGTNAGQPQESLAPEPVYASLALGAAIAVALGGLMRVASTLPLRPVGLVVFAVGLANLFAAVVVGLGRQLGLAALGTGASGFQLTTEPGFGVWLAIAGGAVTALAGLAAALFRLPDTGAAGHTGGHPVGPKVSD